MSTADAKQAVPKRSWEQIIGTRWMLIAGVIMLLAGGYFFYGYAREQGWITAFRRLIAGTVWGLVMIGLGEWMIRRRMKFFAAGLIGVGIGWLYQTAFMASPNGWDTDLHAISSTAAFGWMFAVTVLGIVLSVQTGMLTAAIISIVGAMATPALLSRHENHETFLMCYLLLVDAGFLALAYFKRWQALAPLALVGTAVLFGGWFGKYYYAEAANPMAQTLVFAWALAAVLAAYGLAAEFFQKEGRAHKDLAGTMVLVPSGLLAIVLLYTCIQSAHQHAFALQLLALAGGVTAYGLWRRNQAIVLTAFIAAMATLWGWFQFYRPGAIAANCVYAWAMGILPIAAIYRRRALDSEAWEAVRIALVAVWGAGMAAVLLTACTGSAHRHVFALQLLPAAGAVFAYALWRGNRGMALAAFAAAMGVLWGWFQFYRTPEMLAANCVYTWLMMLLPAVSVALYVGKEWDGTNTALVVLSGAALTAVLLAGCTGGEYRHSLALQLLAVGGLVYAFAMWKGNKILVLGTFIAAMGVLWGWFQFYRTPEMLAANCVYTWLMMLLPAVSVALYVGKDWDGINTALVVLSGVAMTAVLIAGCDGVVFLHAMALQLLAVAGLVYAFALWKSNRVLTYMSFTAAFVVLWAWFLRYGGAATTTPNCVYAWAMMLLPLSALALPRSRTWRDANIIQLAIASTVMVGGWLLLGRRLPAWGLVWQLLALNVVVLAICQWLRWHALRAGLLVWTGLAVFLLHLNWTNFDVFRFAFGPGTNDSAADMLWFTTGWSWAFYALLLGDILIRAWKRSLATREALDAVLTCIATGAMFGGTFVLLDARYHPWMGLYTGLLAAGIAALVVALWRLAGRKMLANTFLVLGLVLFAVAAPIQFDNWAVTVAWTAQGVVAMAVARWLGNKILLLDSPVVLALAMVQFLIHELPDDSLTQMTAMTVFGVSVTYGLLLAAMLAAGFLIAPAALRLGKAILSEKDDRVLACCLVLTAVIFLAVRTAVELPRVAATWWWLVAALALAGVALWRRSKWLAAIGTTFLALAAGKWLAWDTLESFVRIGSDDSQWVAMNWQFFAGILLAAGLLIDEYLLRRREMGMPKSVGLPLFLVASLLVGWGGSFEVHRYFHSAAAPTWVDSYQGTQMGLSIWWALNAAVLMALGFACSKRSLRFLGFAIFAGTIVKVIIVDLWHIHLIYKVLTLMGLGVLLMIGAYLYNRRYRPRA